ncbi:MAG: peptide chain release factor N(5)-glutamine methyltransferase [Candidatus Cloacimonetes bacterium]|nr:peptide chain release factor N(5)-glutamine methyltransferase [Candidatus Cloacimonadota bacterium]
MKAENKKDIISIFNRTNQEQTIYQLQKQIEAILINSTNPKLETELILSHYLNCSRFELYLDNKKTILPENIAIIQKAVKKRLNNVPIQYILNEAYFWGLKFYVDSNVLIPRPETELLIENVLKNHSGKISILDIGTGSGAISIALATELPKADIYASDISSDAIKVAKKNAIYHKTPINFVYSNLFENISTKFDVIISNPPYISEQEYLCLSEEITRYEPKSALVAQNDGYFFYDNILSQAEQHLKEKGKIYFEIGSEQSNKIKELARKYGFKEIRTIKDLNNFDRIMIISK